MRIVNQKTGVIADVPESLLPALDADWQPKLASTPAAAKAAPRRKAKAPTTKE